MITMTQDRLIHAGMPSLEQRLMYSWARSRAAFPSSDLLNDDRFPRDLSFSQRLSAVDLLRIVFMQLETIIIIMRVGGVM